MAQEFFQRALPDPPGGPDLLPLQITGFQARQNIGLGHAQVLGNLGGRQQLRQTRGCRRLRRRDPGRSHRRWLTECRGRTARRLLELLGELLGHRQSNAELRRGAARAAFALSSPWAIWNFT